MESVAAEAVRPMSVLKVEWSNSGQGAPLSLAGDGAAFEHDASPPVLAASAASPSSRPAVSDSVTDAAVTLAASGNHIHGDDPFRAIRPASPTARSWQLADTWRRRQTASCQRNRKAVLVPIDLDSTANIYLRPFTQYTRLGEFQIGWNSVYDDQFSMSVIQPDRQLP